MDVSVLMSSGEVDEWNNVADAIENEGSLIVVDNIEDDEIPDSMKTMEVRQEIPQEPVETEGRLGDYKLMRTPDPVIKTQTFQVLAVYAAGMWMKVEFEQ